LLAEGGALLLLRDQPDEVERKGEKERAALAYLAFDPYIPAVELHYLLRDGEAKPGAPRPVREVVRDPVKLLEYDVPLLRVKPFAGILYRDLEELPVLFRGNRHAAVRGELDGVVQEVHHDERELEPVAYDRGQRLVRLFELQVEPLLPGHRLEGFYAVRYYVRHVHLHVRALGGPGLYLRQVEYAVNELRQARGLLADNLQELPLGPPVDVLIGVQELRERAYRGERGPELMRQVGERRRLSLVYLL
jgi:hypothetical protein